MTGKTMNEQKGDVFEKMQNIKEERKSSLLVEILVVIVIIGLLTTLEAPNLIPHFRGGLEYNARTQAEVQIREIEIALDLYRLHNGFYPTTLQGLNALVSKPVTKPEPKKYVEGGYLKMVPIDPWGNHFIYRNRGKDERELIDIISRGRDGEEGTEDDISNHDI